MTKQEIKNKIKALLFGAHAVDVKENNALPEILDAICDAAFAGTNVQSDWDEDNFQKPEFIRNKPIHARRDGETAANAAIPFMFDTTALGGLSNETTREQLASASCGMTYSNVQRCMSNMVPMIVCIGTSWYNYVQLPVKDIVVDQGAGVATIKCIDVRYNSTSGKVEGTQYTFVLSNNPDLQDPAVTIETFEL